VTRIVRAARQEAFMVSLSNHEGVARTAVRIASWFDKLAMKRSPNGRSGSEG
jgi:hypothetical protein